MSDNSIVESFKDSIFEEAVDITSDLAEVGLDSILEDGTLKDIPFISTAICVYKIGVTIKERHYIKKLARFIDAFNKGIDDDDMRERIKSRFLDEKASKKELEYILLLIDRILDEEKSDLLAKLYLSYLNRKINWEEFISYSNVVDRLLPSDLDYLRLNASFSTDIITFNDKLMRLAGLGLLVEKNQQEEKPKINDPILINSYERSKNKRKYELTEFGKKLIFVFGGFLK